MGDPVAQADSLARIGRLVADGTVVRIVPGHGPALLDDAVAAVARAGR